MRTVVQLTAEDEMHTRVTVTWTIEGAATDVERETFIKGKPSMTGGWTGSFDKLDDYLVAKS